MLLWTFKYYYQRELCLFNFKINFKFYDTDLKQQILVRFYKTNIIHSYFKQIIIL